MQVTCLDITGKKHMVDSKDLINRTSAYGVYIAGGAVLLTQEPHIHRWELPGGGVEASETLSQGLRREFSEETGLTPKGRLVFLAEWEEHFFDLNSKQAWRSKRRFYLVKAISSLKGLLSNGNGDDSVAAKFISKQELAKLHMNPAIRNVIMLAFERK